MTMFLAAKSVAADKAVQAFVAAGVTYATFQLWLKSAGSLFGDALPIFMVAMLISRTVQPWVRRDKSGKPSEGGKTASSLADAAKYVFKHGKVIGYVLLAITLGTILLFAMTKGASAAPLPPAEQIKRARKRLATDDAGDDGDFEDRPRDTDPPWLRAMLADLGMCERDSKGGQNFAARKLVADSNIPGTKLTEDGKIPRGDQWDVRKVPWCMSGLNGYLERSNVPGTRDGMAMSVKRWGRKIDKPYRGCIALYWRNSPTSGEGHVNIYLSETATKVRGCGCNQDDRIKISDMHKRQLLGYYEPRSKWQLRTNQGAAVGATGTMAGGTAIAVDVATEGSGPPTPPIDTEAVTRTLEQIQRPLEGSGHPRAMRWAMILGFVILAIGLGGTCYAMYRRSKDHTESGW